MKMNDLSPEDRALLNTDFGDLEKEAAEQVKVASAMTELGSVYAEELANNFDKVAAEEKDLEEKMEKMDEEEEKKAMDLSAFIERGFTEKLASLGAELTGDSLTFIRPYIVTKLASEGASEGVIKIAMEMKDEAEEEKEEEKEDSKKEASPRLSKEDQALLNTDFGALEKEAAEQIKLANDMYSLGADYAVAVVENMIKEAESCEDDDDEESEKKASEEKEEEMDEESEKKAQDLSAFIERGFSEKLASLGEERHGNALHYFEPYVQEKIALSMAGVKSMGKQVASKGKDLAGKAGKFMKDQASSVAKDARTAATGMVDSGIGSGFKVNNKERAMAAGRAAGKTLLPASVLALSGKKMLGKKKED